MLLGLSLAGVSLWLRENPEIQFPPLLYALIFALVFNSSKLILKKFIPAIINSILTIIVNLAIIFLLIHSTGGIESQFYLALFLVPALATVYFGIGGLVSGLLLIFVAYAGYMFHFSVTEYSISNFVFRSVFLILVSIPFGLFVEFEKRSRQELLSSYKRLRKANKELRETQTQLIQSAKMSALGQLAAGVNHELAHPLATIKIYTQLALSKLNEKSDLQEELKTVEQQTEKMEKIMQDIRGFSRRSQFKPKPLDVNVPLKNVLRFVSHQLERDHIKTRKNLDSGLPEILGDNNQLEQAFLNILMNARDALSGLPKDVQKKLTVTTQTEVNEGDGFVKITFADTGRGIPEVIRDKIFDPFFTAKSKNGLGLGLSITKRIIQNHSGFMEVASQEGQGTTMRIMLPILRSDLKVTSRTKKKF